MNNELYIGRQLWNRLRFVKDPNTGKRISRENPKSEWGITELPELRIIDQETWDKVKSMQRSLDDKPSSLAKRRPKNLLSFLLKCGECGGGMSIVSQGRYGCSSARNKGTCENRVTILKDDLEGRVLDELKSRLMKPELTEHFCQEFTTHINRLRSDQVAEAERNRRELAKIERDMEKTFQAMLDGLEIKNVQPQMEKLQTRKEELERAQRAESDIAPVFVHPNMASQYAQAINGLMKSFNDPEKRDEAANLIRKLVKEIVLTPNADRSALIADMRGDLAAILSIAGPKAPHAKPRTQDQMSNQERKEIERVEDLTYQGFQLSDG